MKKLLFVSAFVVAIAGAFAGKNHKSALPLIYGKVNGVCTALCTTNPTRICTRTSTDGNYFQLSNCTTPYTLQRFEIVN